VEFNVSINQRAEILIKTGRIYNGLILLVSTCVLVGWWTGNTALKIFFMGSTPMSPLTAVFFLLISIALFMSSHNLDNRFLSSFAIYLVVFLISFYTVVQFTIGATFGIEQFLFGRWLAIENGGIIKLTPSTAFLFVMASLSQFTHRKIGKLFSEIVIYAGFAFALFVFLGYVFNVSEFSQYIHFIPSFQTCILFLLLVWAITFTTPTEGFVGLMIGELEGSRIARILFPFTFAIPLLIALTRLQIHRTNYASTEFVVAGVMMTYFIIFVVALIAVVMSLNKRDRQRLAAAKEMQKLNTELTDLNNKQQDLNKHLSTSNAQIVASSVEVKLANEKLRSANSQLGEALVTIKEQDEVIILQKEEALKRSQQYLEIVFSSTEEEILLLDTNGRAVLFNNAFEQFVKLAMGKKPVIGEYVWNLTVTEDAETVKQLFEQALSGQLVKREVLVPLPARKVFHFLRYEPIYINGKVEFVTIISTDITQQKDASEQLAVQYEELQKINYELDRFVYSVSHDLRAPLSSVLGLISVAEMENNGKELPYLKLIKERIRHLDGFIRSILDYSRNARTEVTPTLIVVTTAVQEVKDSVRTMNGFNSIDIQVNIQENAPFYSDAIRFIVILNNLITNAIKFQDYHKPDSYLRLDFNITEQALQLRASDNGIGIASDHLQKVFDMFYRGTASASGSGIGLYLVKQTIEKMNGTITLTSELGKYTTFELVLPNSKGEHQ
jgi:PAS domain S-box-containing protein